MSANEYAFLVAGLVLGIAAGAAIAALFRSRPQKPREVRVTITPASEISRPVTLAPDAFEAPARGGPGEMPASAAAGGLVPRTVRAMPGVADRDDSAARPLVAGAARGHGGSNDGPGGLVAAGNGTPVRSPGSGPSAARRDRVAVPIETDHSAAAAFREAILGAEARAALVLDRLTPSAAAPRTAARAFAASGPLAQRRAVASADGNRSWGGRAVVRTGVASADGADEPPPAGTAASEPPTHTTRTNAGSGAAGPEVASAGGDSPRPARAAGPEAASSGGDSPRAAGAGDATPAGAPRPATSAVRGSSPATPDAGTDPCAPLRRAADERCSFAAAARERSNQATAAFRNAKRRYDDHQAAAERAAQASDPVRVRAAKDDAQRAFHAARDAARARAELEAAARAWLAEINRINGTSRDAAAALTKEREAVVALVTTVERLSVEADVARIAAETAEDACVAAREAFADCEEAAAAAANAAAFRAAAATDATRAPSAPSSPGAADATRGSQAGGADGQPTAVTPTSTSDPGSKPGRRPAGPGWQSEPDESDAIAAASTGGEPLVLALVRGDRQALGRVAAALGGHDADARRIWMREIGRFVEAIVSRAIEGAALEFPPDHAFWSLFTRDQSRDIAAALASLGFRFDGLGGWVDARVPGQRDLSLALGYAGVDPMRIRRWPTEAEAEELYRDVQVAADEYLAGAAGGLTLGELVSLLGRRADALTDVWNAWGRIRPVLLEPANASSR